MPRNSIRPTRNRNSARLARAALYDANLAQYYANRAERSAALAEYYDGQTAAAGHYDGHMEMPSGSDWNPDQCAAGEDASVRFPNHEQPRFTKTWWVEQSMPDLAEHEKTAWDNAFEDLDTDNDGSVNPKEWRDKCTPVLNKLKDNMHNKGAETANTMEGAEKARENKLVMVADEKRAKRFDILGQTEGAIQKAAKVRAAHQRADQERAEKNKGSRPGKLNMAMFNRKPATAANYYYDGHYGDYDGHYGDYGDYY